MLQSTLFIEPARSVPKVISVFSFRYEAHLVPALIENIRPMVHGFVSYDDRMAAPGFSDEPARRNALHAAARDMGADWILAVDPDERYESTLAERIGTLTADRDGRTLWVFHLREMFSESAYRTDGLWGGKTQMRLYPARATLMPLSQGLHGRWVAPDPSYRDVSTGLNLYHLRHASMIRTINRRDTYAAADPTRQFHSHGYDYLADMRGMRLRDIAPGREFNPPHIEDHGLWAAQTAAMTDKLIPDPPECKLRLMARLRRLGQTDNAAYAAQDLVEADPADQDLSAVAATMALQAGRPADALSILGAHSGETSVLSRLTEAAASESVGAGGRAKAAFAAAAQLAGDCQTIRHLSKVRSGHKAEFTARNALWRRWVKGVAVLHEGGENGSGRLCVIVAGYKAPQSLASVVAAVRAQSDDIEIVVVNSGGGNPALVLNDYLPFIRLIDMGERLYVGAARNIGIDASRAPLVSFLADDCIPLPGWVAGRLSRHDAGALMVASAVQPANPGTVRGYLVRTLVFSKRDPSLSEDAALMYGRSYHRSVFGYVGYFATGMRTGEDTEFNRRADVITAPVWAPEIVVRHLDPRSILGILSEVRLRARRYAMHIRPKGGSAPGQDWIADRLLKLRMRVGVAVKHANELDLLRRQVLKAAAAVGVFLTKIGYRQADRIVARAEGLEAHAAGLSETDITAAISLMRQAVTLVPHDWRVHVELGKLHLRQSEAGSVDRALACFTSAAAIAPTETAPLVAATHYLVPRGNEKKAFQLCQQAIITAPVSPGRLMEAAHVSRRNKRPELALYFAQLGLVADPSAYRVHDLLELLHREAGRSEMARRRKETSDRLRGAKPM